jgi:Ni,Fe-hydrogenase III large subunit/Ni,Fe-hydrogenase III component G
MTSVAQLLAWLKNAGIVIEGESLPAGQGPDAPTAPAASDAPVRRLRGARIVRERELHATADPACLPALTATLRGDFGAELIAMVGEDRRHVDGLFHVHYLFAHSHGNWFVHVMTDVPPETPQVPSAALSAYPASRFEREIRDLMGIVPTGHPDARALVRHAFWPERYYPLRKDAIAPEFSHDGSVYPHGEVRGAGVYEIPVGPIHAGIIEPGHFRFSALGETIIDCKQRLFYTHKGTEKLFEGRTPEDGVELAERISGDTSVGHALAYCQAVEAAAGLRIPRRAAYIRAVLLELERLYNHVADFGMIVSDTGYAIAHAHGYRIREALLRINHALTGHRLLRGGVALGGARDGILPDESLADHVDDVVRDFLEVVDVCLGNSLVMDRLDRTGVLDRHTATDHAVRGYVARASGLDIDARRDHPMPPYDTLDVRVPVQHSGDVRARAVVRVEEAKESARLIRILVETLPGGSVLSAIPALPAYEPAFGLVEGWRGLIVHWVMGDERGRLHRVKVVDPSFVNWPALSRALADNIVPDFPLCNKSFNLSYSGNDL